MFLALNEIKRNKLRFTLIVGVLTACILFSILSIWTCDRSGKLKSGISR